MSEINCPYELTNSTDDESDYISNEVMHSNNSGVPLPQKKAPIFKHYVLKDNNKVIGKRQTNYAYHLIPRSVGVGEG